MSPTESNIRARHTLNESFIISSVGIDIRVTPEETTIEATPVIGSGLPKRLISALQAALDEWAASDSARNWAQDRWDREVEREIEDAGDDARTHEERER